MVSKLSNIGEEKNKKMITINRVVKSVKCKLSKKRGQIVEIVENCQYLKSNCQKIVEITKEIVENV